MIFTEETLGKALKKEGITQKRFHEVLTQKYDCNITLATFATCYARQLGWYDTPMRRLIARCADEEYGLVYHRGGWVRKETT